MEGSINTQYNCPMEGKYVTVTLGNIGADMVAITLNGKGLFSLLNDIFPNLIMVKEMVCLLEEERKQA